MSFSDMLNFPDLPEPLDLSSIDDRSSLSQSATSSPTNFFDGCLLSPASILPGSMATPDTSTGSESDETCAYTQLFRQYQRCEQELLKTQQELESLRTTHKTVVESHSLLIATYIETTRTPRVEDRAPLPEPGSALVPHAPSGTAFPPPVTQIQGPSRPRRSWKEMKERKYSYTIPMTPGIGVSARNLCAADWLAKNPEGKAGEFFRYWDIEIDLKEKAAYEEQEVIELAQLEAGRKKRAPPPRRAPRK